MEGNLMKMREALENSNGLLEELAAIGEWDESAREQIAENNAALSASTRNCNRYAEQVLIDNGIDADKAKVVLQAIGYALLDKELYPNGI